jgi:hypothetical protein
MLSEFQVVVDADVVESSLGILRLHHKEHCVRWSR